MDPDPHSAKPVEGQPKAAEHSLRRLTAVELIVSGVQSLSPLEQDELLRELGDLRLRRLAKDTEQSADMLRSLAQVALIAGPEMTIADNRDARAELMAQGARIPPIGRVIACFGTWVEAKEALTLSKHLTAGSIEARLRRRRRLAKVWRYTEETLAATLARATAHYGRPPQVAEFAWWRECEFRVARAKGQDPLHLPSATPYRRRWGSWEAALLHFGYEPAEVERRLERGSA
jgi:Homing endonuclease associated repeat